MRVVLLHNSSAGSEEHTASELTRIIEKAGHRVLQIVADVNDLQAALHNGACDLVVVAGGDGTVGRAACRLSGWGIPIAILPLGTANNTACSLGLPKQLKAGVKRWDDAERVPFDLGLLNDGVEQVRFAECVGWGVFTRAIVEAKSLDAVGNVTRTLKRDRKVFRSMLHATEPRAYQIEVDGRDCSGYYVLVEILNIPLLGPQLMLSEASDPSDGHLEVVLVTEAERAAMDLVAKTGKPSPGYRVLRGKRIRIESDDALLHRDGSVVRYPLGNRVFDIHVEPTAVHYIR